MVHTQRFLDLLDLFPFEEEEEEGNAEEVDVRMGPDTCLLASHNEIGGPLNWNAHCSFELQRILEHLIQEKSSELQLSISVADPTLPDCPIVACSSGFMELTGYHLHEIVGRNCRMLLDGVPTDLIDDEVRTRCRSFCQFAKQGQEYDGKSEVLPKGDHASGILLPMGELVCIQTNAKKSGELFKNMFYLRQVTLDHSPYIVAVHAGIPDECEDVAGKCYTTWSHLDGSMAIIEMALALHFWYQAPMRRQKILP